MDLALAKHTPAVKSKNELRNTSIHQCSLSHCLSVGCFNLFDKHWSKLDHKENIYVNMGSFPQLGVNRNH